MPAISRRFSTGDIRIKPSNERNENFTPRKPKSLRQASPLSARRQRRISGLLPSEEKSVEVSKESVYNYPLSKSEELRETELIKEKSTSMRRNPGPDARELRSKFPKRGISATTDKMSIVTNHIILGSKRDAGNKVLLDNMGITHILNAAQQVPNHYPNDYIYLKLHILDDPSTNITKSYAAASSFISRVEKKKGRVLVHCVSGVSRSVAIVIMHLIGKYRMHLKNAYNHIYSMRPYIHPNNGFKVQMALFELEYLGTSSVANSTAGEAWSFYEWNSIRNQYRHQSVDGTEGIERDFADVCCSIS